jgi:2-polyprenyl-3-methyl-5-hydroxy-6-metoxy-1,4-benzoquinol methylase
LKLNTLNEEELTQLLVGHGRTDLGYLERHYGRLYSTLAEFYSTWDITRCNKVLDIGAHWLHQAVLWKQAGFEITAVDMPMTFEIESIQSLARQQEISLIPCSNLEMADAFDVIPDSSIGIILFTEIIEHLEFNPVQLWKQIYRILKPGGRIIVTTPNYYAWDGRMWDIWRFLSGFGGGISVDDILNTKTYGHHWREFSRHEVIRYFHLLTPEFNTIKAKTVKNYLPESGLGGNPIARKVI